MNLLVRNKYWKAIIPAIATILTAILPMLSGTADNSPQAWINVTIMAFGTIVAFTSTNMSEGVARYTKEIVGALTAGLVLLTSLLSDGVTHDEWVQVGVAVLMALLLPLKANDGYVHGVKPSANLSAVE